MATLSFETLRFEDRKDFVRVNFLNLFHFDVQPDVLERIGRFSLEKNSITFENVSEKRAVNKFNLLLADSFRSLKNRVNSKQTIYIHKNSGIPLIGNISFGIIDRGSNLLEVRPISSCNIKCIYCSVDEDARPVDFVVESDYIVEEARKIADYKGEGLQIHIGSQGEPMLYADMVSLIRGLKQIPQIKFISIVTNGTLLNEKLIDELVEAGLDMFNLSLNAMNKELAVKIADAGYNLERILKIAGYISKKAELVIAPVWIPGINDEEIEQLIEFTKSLKNDRFTPKAGIQKYLHYKFGRNPANEMPWEEFYAKLRALEQKHNVKLVVDEKDFGIKGSKPLPKPFKKGEIVEAEIVCNGRLSGEKIAVAKERTISVFGAKKNGKARVRITRDKHNIFAGEVV